MDRTHTLGPLTELELRFLLLQTDVAVETVRAQQYRNLICDFIDLQFDATSHDRHPNYPVISLFNFLFLYIR